MVTTASLLADLRRTCDADQAHTLTEQLRRAA